MKQYFFPIAVECLEEGGYYAECPLLPGCHVEGKTYSEAVRNLDDAIRIFLRSYRDLGKSMPLVPKLDRRVVVTGGIAVPIREVS